MRDPVLKSLGIKAAGALPAEVFDLVVRHTEHFARSGGVVTWDLWRKLNPSTKAAFVTAFEKIRAEEAAAIGMASQGPRQAAQVLAVSDGGDLDCRLSLDRFIESLGG